MKDMKNRVFRFDNVEISVENLRVTVDSEIRPLEPKSFRLLLFLIENPGRALSKDEIMGVVWRDVAVSDNSLARAITQTVANHQEQSLADSVGRYQLPAVLLSLHALFTGPAPGAQSGRMCSRGRPGPGDGQ